MPWFLSLGATVARWLGPPSPIGAPDNHNGERQNDLLQIETIISPDFPARQASARRKRKLPVVFRSLQARRRRMTARRSLKSRALAWPRPTARWRAERK